MVFDTFSGDKAVADRCLGLFLPAKKNLESLAWPRDGGGEVVWAVCFSKKKCGLSGGVGGCQWPFFILWGMLEMRSLSLLVILLFLAAFRHPSPSFLAATFLFCVLGTVCNRAPLSFIAKLLFSVWV